MTRALRVLAIVGTITALAIVLIQLDPSAVRHAVRDMSWRWAGVTIAINMIGIVIDASRWQLIVRVRHRVTFWNVYRAHLAGVVGNMVVPFKLGESARVLMLARTERLPPATVLSTMLLDRTIDAAFLPLFIGGASLLLPLPASIMQFRVWMLAATVGFMLALFGAGRWVRRQPSTDTPLATGRTIERLVAGLAALGHTWSIAGVLLLATASWVTRTATIWCMIQAFHLPLSLTAAVASLAIINLSIAIVATPGNVGTLELATVAALGLWGTPPDIALSLGLAMHALEVVPTILFGLTIGIAPRPSQAVNRDHLTAP